MRTLVRRASAACSWRETARRCQRASRTKASAEVEIWTTNGAAGAPSSNGGGDVVANFCARGNRALQDGGNLPDFIHQLIELVREDRLVAIGERRVRIVVHFHHQSIGTHGDGRSRQRRDLVAFAGAVARVD